MTGKTHLAAGVTFGLVTLFFRNVDPIIFMAGSLIGSQVPDLDHKKSTVSAYVPLIDDVIVNSSKAVRKFKIKKLKGIFSHRGFTHSLIPVIALGVFNSMFKLDILLGLLIGYISHLFMDMLTKDGIPLFLPLSLKKFNLLRIKTGGKLEGFVWLMLWLINFGLGYLLIIK